MPTSKAARDAATISRARAAIAADRPADAGLAPCHAPGQEHVAWGRAETDPCERGTVGCSVRHTRDSECETW
jgi:hypothetical protein